MSLSIYDRAVEQWFEAKATSVQSAWSSIEVLRMRGSGVLVRVISKGEELAGTLLERFLSMNSSVSRLPTKCTSGVLSKRCVSFVRDVLIDEELPGFMGGFLQSRFQWPI